MRKWYALAKKFQITNPKSQKNYKLQITRGATASRHTGWQPVLRARLRFVGRLGSLRYVGEVGALAECVAVLLGFGIWDFFGIWDLEFGISLSCEGDAAFGEFGVD